MRVNPLTGDDRRLMYSNWEKKKRKQYFHGIVPGFGGGFCLCVFSIRNDPTKKKTHKQLLGTHPVPGQSRKFVYVYMCFFFP